MRKCIEDGCEETKIKGRGMCGKCYDRAHWRGEIESEPCPVPDCSRPRNRRGLCLVHREEFTTGPMGFCMNPECSDPIKPRSRFGERYATARARDRRCSDCRGEAMPAMMCALGCGRTPGGTAEVCRICSAELRAEGKRRCPVHGVLTLDQFQKSGSGACKLCAHVRDRARYDAKYSPEKCIFECGRNRQSGGNSEVCRECYLELQGRGLWHCRVHGPVPVSDVSHGECKACTQKRKKQIYRESRRNVVESALREQNYLCEICEFRLTTKTACIDHDHEHGCSGSGCPKCRRSLLCGRCNTLLGRYHDDPTMMDMASAKTSGYPDGLLESGAAYLKRWNAIMVERGVRKRDILEESMQWMFGQMSELLASHRG